MKPLLSIKNLSFYLAQSCIIEDFSFNFYKGEIVTLFGPSGCGKTTLLKLISNIISLQDGNIECSGKISYLFQEHRLFESVTAYDNIALVMQNPDKKWILESLQSVGLSLKDSLKTPNELSGGMRARVAFIRALAFNGDLLLLDEPFSGLDSMMREILIKKVTYLAKTQNLAVILVTHDAYEACRLSDKILFLSHKKMKIQKDLAITKTQDSRNDEFLSELKSEFKGRIYFD